MATAAGLLLTLGLLSPISASSFVEPLLAIEKESEDISTATCPEKWIDASFVEMGCLLFNSTTTYTWDKANNYCQSHHNATLLEILTEMEMAFIQMEANVLGDHEGERDWWTSGTDAGRQGVWMWASSYTPVDDFIWYTGEPNTNSFNCLSLENIFNFLGEDDDCASTRYPICQIK